ncbi:glucuronate isomerase [Actinotignum urinale]|uniref:glucuronate isomerase n=1 Tax=Actinotignum urinale TaxID=190146 RepID=UPI002A80E401|nr:glucuronate isomerase [Actinotignum urinale]MDY5152104.1 glucuronate isomerase [Actinotignum urinale]
MTKKKLELHPDRLFPADEKVRGIARELFAAANQHPIISPHGHVPPEWLAEDIPFNDPVSMLLTPDHYTNRILHGTARVDLADLGVPVGTPMTEEQSRNAWRLFCKNWWAFRGTAVQFWFTSEFVDVFGVDIRPSEETADEIYDIINEQLKTDAFKPRALYKRFNISLLATTDDPASDLRYHKQLNEDPAWDGKVIPTFRPDAYIEPARPGFKALTEKLGEAADQDVSTYEGHVEAMRKIRRFFKENGAVSSDHSHRDAGTARLSDREATDLYQQALAGKISVEDGDRLRRHMLNDQARLACEDGLVMTLHPAVFRNHDEAAFARLGADVGGDVPMATEFTAALQPMLTEYGNHENFQTVLFTMDQDVFQRELAPLAGYYPSVFVGAPWWFLDEPDAMRRYREQVTPYGTFYKTSGFIDDTRAFASIPARHDVARRMDAVYLARLVAEHRLALDEAQEIAEALVTTIPSTAFKLN